MSWPLSHTHKLKFKGQSVQKIKWKWLAAWHSGVSGRRTFPVPRSISSWRVTAYVGKPSAIGQPTRLTQPFIISGSINWVVSNVIGCMQCAGRAIWWVFTRLSQCGYQSLCAMCGSNLAELNPFCT